MVNGKTNRRKGHQFERDIAREMREVGFRSAKRHLEYQDGEAYGVDIAGTYPLHIQCKAKKNYVSINTIDEILREDGIRLLLTKADRQPVMAVMRWEDLKEILRRIDWQELTESKYSTR